jgi:hypothetical protein
MRGRLGARGGALGPRPSRPSRLLIIMQGSGHCKPLRPRNSFPNCLRKRLTPAEPSSILVLPEGREPNEMTAYDNWKNYEGPATRDSHDVSCEYCKGTATVVDDDGATVPCEDCGGHGFETRECDGHDCPRCECNERCCAY